MHEVMASGRGELAKHISTWLATLNQAADHESWGQPVEASELYKKLVVHAFDLNERGIRTRSWFIVRVCRLTKMIRIVLTSNIQISDASKVTKARINLKFNEFNQVERIGKTIR